MRLRVVLCAMLVAACGSAAPDRAADRQIAEQSGFKLEDFPSGWKQVGEDGGDDKSCRSIVAAQAMTTAHRTGARFGREVLQSQSAIYVFADEAAARKGYERIGSAETRKCLADAMTEGLGDDSDVQLGTTRTSSLAVDAPGDESQGARLVVPVTGRGVDTEVNADLVFARTGRGVAIFAFISAIKPFDEGLRRRLTKTGVDRLTQGLTAG
jgi:hypothetical protein